MLTEQDLLETIEQCRAVRKPTAATVQLLASCYVILDHLTGEQLKDSAAPLPRYSNAAPMKSRAAETEFGRVATNAPFDVLMDVIEEHMECIKVLYPREYAAVLRKLME